MYALQCPFYIKLKQNRQQHQTQKYQNGIQRLISVHDIEHLRLNGKIQEADKAKRRQICKSPCLPFAYNAQNPPRSQNQRRKKNNHIASHFGH